MKGLSDNFPQGHIVVVKRVKGDGLHLGNIHMARLIQHPLIHAHIDNLAHQTAGLFIIALQLAFHATRELLNQRSIHKLGLHLSLIHIS